MFSPGQMRHGWALLSATAACAVCMAVAVPPVQADEALAVPTADEPAAPPSSRSADSAEADSSPAELARQARVRQSLNIYLVRDREYSVLLETAAGLIGDGRATTAIRQLQDLLDAPQDVFVWDAAGAVPQSARTEAIALLRSLPAGGRAEYERLFGADARRLLQEYQTSGNPAHLSTLLQRYRLTEAGANALELSAQTAMDHGRFVEAAANWRLWLEDRGGDANHCRTERLQAEIAAQLAALEGVEIVLPPFDGRQPVSFAGQTKPAEEWVQEFVATATVGRNQNHSAGSAHAIVARDDDVRTAVIPTSSPLWVFGFADDQSDPTSGVEQVAHVERTLTTAEILAHWQSGRTAQRIPCAGANVALVQDGCLLVKDYNSVTARDLHSGDVRWRFPLNGALEERIGRIPVPDAATTATDPRAAAAQVFESEFVANSVLGSLTCDGRRVYFIDSTPADSAAESGEGPAPQVTNRLVAVRLGDDGQSGGVLAWEFPPASRNRSDHRGWFLLGAPTPTPETLFVMEERDDEIHLLALDPATGALRWDQPVSLVDRGIDECAHRQRAACSPVVANGIVLCPTQLGTLVAVDSVSGRLLWVYSYSDFSGPSQPWRGARSSETQHGRPEFVNPPLVARGRVLTMTPHTDHVHCVDLLTGRRLWKQPREEALSATLAGDELLLVISLRECRAIRVSDGEPIWRTRIEAPQGRGIAVGGSFLLPGSNGRMQMLDIATGELAPDLLPQPRLTNTVLRAGGDPAANLEIPIATEPPHGNLTLYEDYVISCGPAGVAVYPRADVALAALQQSAEDASPDGLRRIAELQLRLGRVADARQSLQAALQQDPDPPLRTTIERHLREVLYRAMMEERDVTAVAALDPLARTPDERSRFLALRLELELAAADFETALQTAAELESLNVQHPVAMDGRERFVVEPAVLAAAALDRARAAQTRTVVTPRVLNLDHESDLSRLRSLIALSGTAAERSSLTRALAGELIARGALQEAELLLIRETVRDDPDAAVASALMLAELWATQGLTGDAAALLAQTTRRWNGCCFSDGSPATAVLPSDWRALPPVGYTGETATIEELYCPDDCPHSLVPCNCSEWSDLFERNREFSRCPGSPRVLFDRGTHGASEKYALLSIVDAAGRHGLLDLQLKPKLWRVGDTSRSEAGHFLPLASGEVHGVSLLEGRLMWTADAEWNSAGDKPILGPYGTQFCVLQAGETVFALDPLDGRTLWRRSDFDHDAGLASDEVSGMFGDERALVVFDADHLHYRVLDPRSGEQLRSGVLELTKEDLRKRRWSFGRKLMYTTSAAGAARLVLWDPLTDSLEIDMPLERRLLVDGSAGRNLAAVLNGDRLAIIDTETGAALWEHQYEAKQLDGARMLRVVHDLRRFYIHFERDSTGSQFSPATGDLELPNLQLGGLLSVVDRDTGEHWERTMPRSNLLWFPSEQLPVIMTLARLRDSRQGQNIVLALEVLDAATGRTLAQREDLHKTSLVHAACDPAEGVVELSGVGTRIIVRYAD